MKKDWKYSLKQFVDKIVHTFIRILKIAEKIIKITG